MDPVMMAPAPPAEPIAPAPEGPVAAEPMAPTPAPPAAAELTELETPSTDADTGKYVPLAAAKMARQEAQALKAQNAALAEHAMALEHALRERAQPAAPPPPAAPAAEPPLLSESEAEGLARTMELYDAAGKPDLTRARYMASVIDRIAAQKAQQTIEPLAATTARDLAERFRVRAGATKDPQGRPIDTKVLDYMWSAVPPELASLPNVAAVLTYAAAGYERMHAQPPGPAPPAQAPVKPERAGGRVDAGSVLSEWELQYLHSQGKDPAAYTAALKHYKPGTSNVIEE